MLLWKFTYQSAASRAAFSRPKGSQIWPNARHFGAHVFRSDSVTSPSAMYKYSELEKHSPSPSPPLCPAWYLCGPAPAEPTTPMCHAVECVCVCVSVGVLGVWTCSTIDRVRRKRSGPAEFNQWVWTSTRCCAQYCRTSVSEKQALLFYYCLTSCPLNPRQRILASNLFF